MKEKIDSPFVGLRPFESEDRMLFFGREEQTTELLQRLHYYRFVAVVGSSGSGKSSLIRAGLIPMLEAGFLVKDRDRWHIASMRPGGAPLSNLAATLVSLNARNINPQDMERLRNAIAVSGTQAVLDALVPLLEDTDANLLLLVDQFEELFRYRSITKDDKDRNEADDFVSIMLGLAEQRTLPVYVVMTMRSDFLGDCVYFHGLPEMLNRSQYLVPRLTQIKLGEAIQGPIRLFGADISQGLLNRLLDDVEDTSDQLPILQHALMRTWDTWLAHRNADEPLDLVYYEEIGGVAAALSRHADTVFEELGDDTQRNICENIFKALTDKTIDARGVRRPTLLSELCDIASAREAEVCTVIDSFRRKGRSFLMPPVGSSLSVHTVIDISHESFMRNWKRLKMWADMEAESAQMYRRLAETAVLYNQGRADLLRGTDLQVVLDWIKTSQPNNVWARRYHPEFELAMNYLEKSKRRRRILPILLRPFLKKYLLF